MSRDNRREALVVEDDPTMRETLKDVLHEEGYAATGVGTVDDARRHLTTGARPHVVLLDLELDGAPGDVLLDELSRRSTAPPTVVVSGDVEARDIARRFGVACVTKPSGITRLTDEIERSVESHRRPRTQGPRE